MYYVIFLLGWLSIVPKARIPIAVVTPELANCQASSVGGLEIEVFSWLQEFRDFERSNVVNESLHLTVFEHAEYNSAHHYEYKQDGQSSRLKRTKTKIKTDMERNNANTSQQNETLNAEACTC